MDWMTGEIDVERMRLIMVSLFSSSANLGFLYKRLGDEINGGEFFLYFWFTKEGKRIFNNIFHSFR